MDRITLYEDKNLKLDYVSEGNYLHETWWGITLKDTFEKLMNVIAKSLNEHNADGVLLDTREHKGLGPEAQEYAARTIGEYAKKHGKFKEAIVMPKDVFSAFSVENYSKKVSKDNPVEVKFFGSIDKAVEWLRSTN
jgi:hypothetical protein